MQIVWAYLGIVNILAFAITAYDKHAAKAGKWRVKERTLLFVSAAGGSAATLLAMLALRHKTRKPQFTVGVPAMLVLQALFIAFGFNQSLH
jgi:uncharacterized membrane protein YsdA (DUF1294 family)